MIDDSKSDNTDDLLTSLEPMLAYSSVLLNQHTNSQFDIPRIPLNEMLKPTDNIVLEDILSQRSEISNSRIKLSKENLAKYEESLPDSERTVSTKKWTNSVTPQNFNLDNMEREDLLNKIRDLVHEKEQIESETRTAKVETHRQEISNKQLQSQLRDTKAALQSVTIQLEHAQQECIHKESALENLDRTLGGLVSAWKKREAQKNSEIIQITQQIQEKEKTIEEFHKINEETKQALINADKVLANEQEKHENIQEELMKEIDLLRKQNCKLKEDNFELDTEIDRKNEEIRKIKENNNKLIKDYEHKEEKFVQNEINLQKKIRKLEEELVYLKESISGLENELQNKEYKIMQTKQEMDQWEEEANKWRKETLTKDEEVKKLKGKLNDVEIESLGTIKRMEKEIGNNLNENFRKNFEEIKIQHKKEIQKLTSEWNQKLSDRSAKQKQELEKMRQTAEKEISNRLLDAEETIKCLRDRLDRSEQSVRFWQKEKESVERARSQLSMTLYQTATQFENPNHQKTSQNSHALNDGIVTNRNGGNTSAISDQLSIIYPQNYFEPIKSSQTNLASSEMINQRSYTKPIYNSYKSSTNSAFSYQNPSKYTSKQI